MIAQRTRDLAIGLVLYNSADDLAETLSSTAAVAQELGHEILAFDNASNDQSAKLAEMHPNVVVNRSDRNGGFAYGVNGLFAMARDRDLLLLNPDVRLECPEQVRGLMRGLVSGVGVVAPRLRNPNGTIQESARRFPTFAGMAGRSTLAQKTRTGQRAAKHYVRLPLGDTAAPVDWVIGAAMLISNEANRSVGGWDEGFFLYLEDVDFCLRLAQAGWSTMYHPEVEFLHTHHRASDASRGGSLFRSSARRHHIKSTLRFFAKHRSLSPTVLTS